MFSFFKKTQSDKYEDDINKEYSLGVKERKRKITKYSKNYIDKIESMRSALFSAFMQSEVKQDTDLYKELQFGIKQLKKIYSKASSAKNNDEDTYLYEEKINTLFDEEVDHIAIVSFVVEIDILYISKNQQDRLVSYLKILNKKLEAIANNEALPVLVENKEFREDKIDSIIDIATGTTSEQRDRINNDFLNIIFDNLDMNGSVNVKNIQIKKQTGEVHTYSGVLSPLTGVYYSITLDNGELEFFNASEIIDLEV